MIIKKLLKRKCGDIGKLLEKDKPKIEMNLYPGVLANVEVMIGKQEKLNELENLSKKFKLTKQEKLSKPNMLEVRKNTISNIVKLIQEFSIENDLDINEVKEYLLELISRDLEKEKIFQLELIELKSIMVNEHAEEQK